MTRERAKELLPVIQAFAEGKTIQVLSYTGKWHDIEHLNLYDNNEYRIKPESSLRPYTFEEMCEAVNMHGNMIIWTSRNGSFVISISSFTIDHLTLGSNPYDTYEDFAKFCTWLDDNSPCGVME